MNKCAWTPRVEQWFDGVTDGAETVEQHADRCPICARRLAELRLLRAGTAEIVRREEIRDAQFGAFFAGIRERVETPSRRPGKVWALLSLTAAALIVAIAAFLILTSGPAPAKATKIESCSTDLQGATVTAYESNEGVPTVWLTVPATQDDIP